MTHAGRFAAITALAACFAAAEAVPVRYAQAYLHGFLVLEDMEGKTLAAGEATQVPGAGRVTMTLRLHFRDGSLHEEIAVFSQRRSFQLLSYKEVQRGPSFKQPLTLSFDASGKATVVYTGKDGAERTNSAQLNLPEDVSNGILPMLMCNLTPRVENTLSMVVAAPKPEVVKLKIDPAAEATFTVGGVSAKANHFVVHIDLGALKGTVAKVVGKQPPPTDMWIASGNAPVFLKSEGPLYEDGPIWRIRLASPAWGRSGRGPGD